MHGGHGHSHAHHEHEHAGGKAVNFDEVPASVAIGREVSLSTWGRLLRSPKRKSFQVIFAALVVFGPALVRWRPLAKQDMCIFLVVASTLSIFDSGRRTARRVIQRAKSLQESLLKHTTPLTRKYFFKNENAADRVTLLGVVVNVLLSGGKFTAGILCHSSVLIADAGHSLSDLISDFVTLWAVQIARLPPDDDHPYGHGKFEAIGSLFLAMTLLGTGLGIGVASYHRLVEVIGMQRAGIKVGTHAMKSPTRMALVAAGVSIWSKEWLFRITRRVGNALNSQVVIANAWHHRSDAFSSVLALISIALAMAFPGLLWMDSGAGILVSGMICTTGFEILLQSVKELTDTADEVLVTKIERDLGRAQDISAVKSVKARTVGSSALVDVTVRTPKGLSASAVRAIEERLRWQIMEREPNVMDVVVHAQDEGEVVCPLLTAHAQGGQLGAQLSAAQVSTAATGIIVKHPSVLSVERVQVHFEDTILVSVEAAIRLDPASSITQAEVVASELRERLQTHGGCDRARIYIDLQDDHSMLDTVPAVPAPAPAPPVTEPKRIS